jgi:ABC-type antimicrobial peptide transport system permease subunit
MIETAQNIPGVSVAALVDWPPLSNGSLHTYGVYKDDAEDLRPANTAATAGVYRVSPEYFRAAGTKLLTGRQFNWSDNLRTRDVAIVNPEFARRLFGSMENADGRYFKLRDGRRIQVVGIAEQGKYQSLSEDPKPAMFVPILQWPSSHAYIVLRSGRDPAALAADIRNRLRELDGGVPLLIQTWSDALDLVLFPSRAVTVAFGVLGIVGAVLSVTGIFGFAAFSVTRRLRELGIRVAVGATASHVLQTALGRAFRLFAFGCGVGLLVGFAGSRVIASIVYQASARDPFVLVSVVLTMLIIGLLGAWLPAQRALSVNALALLREE